jgi:ribosome-binding factor A
MTSVTEVHVAPDLKTCKVYVSVLGDDEKKKMTLAGLERSKGYIRHLLAQNLNMRITPELFFRLDESIEYGNRMSALIDEVIGKDRGTS